jgi:Thrombospondin type 3 repeat
MIVVRSALLIVLFVSVWFGIGGASDIRAELPIMDSSRTTPEAAFRQLQRYGAPAMPVPTVLEIPLVSESYAEPHVAIFDETDSTFEPIYVRTVTSVQEVPYTMTADVATPQIRHLFDKNRDTFTEFAVPREHSGVVTIRVVAEQPIQSSGFTITLPRFVALPNKVEVLAEVEGVETVVLAEKALTGSTIQFPETTAASWSITFTYGQPLRIAELELRNDTYVSSLKRFVRFLAAPGHTYVLYFDSDRQSVVPTGEAGNLRAATGVKAVQATPSMQNPAYVIADMDSDGVPDVNDNCVSVSNTDQVDVNANGRGDACDDYDFDGLINSRDNCTDEPNRTQADTDADGIGDACDTEESRFTEKYPWLPWVGMGFAGLVIVILFSFTFHAMQKGATPPRDESDDAVPPPPTPQA